MVAAVGVTPAQAVSSGTDVDSISSSAEAALVAVDLPIGSALDFEVDSEGGATAGESMTIQDGLLEFPGSPLSIVLPVAVSAVTDFGAAVGVDSDTGLGIVVSPTAQGTARILTVAEEQFSATAEHQYRYELELSGTVEARQLSTGEVVLIETAPVPVVDAAFEPAPDLDVAEYAAVLAQSAESRGPASDPELKAGEAVVGAFMTPWSVDANGQTLDTHFELQGATLVQVVDTTDAAFPVVFDPVPLVIIGIAALARVFAPVAMRAFATSALRVGSSTPSGGFATFARFQTWAGAAKPGYQWHHIVGQSQTRFAAGARHHSQNLVMIPTSIHQKCVSSWMSRKYVGTVAGKAFTRASTVRSQVEAMSYPQQHAWGLKLLRVCGVNV